MELRRDRQAVGRTLATIAATLGLIAALVAPFRVTRVFVANAGHGPGILGLWMVLPIAAGAGALAAVRTQSIRWVWAAIGAVWGFIVIAAWSFGPFFAWEGMALLVAGLLHLVTVGPWWRLLLVPLWLVAGATAFCPVFLAIDVVREMRSGGSMTVTHAPIVVSGSYLFVAVVTLLGVIELIARRSGRQIRTAVR